MVELETTNSHSQCLDIKFCTSIPVCVRAESWVVVRDRSDGHFKFPMHELSPDPPNAQ